MTGITQAERDAMVRAFELARRGPLGINPQVGCVLLTPAGDVLAEGWHRGVGMPHAEVAALAQLPDGAARGATAVVSLEPCNHTGHTGPCSEALLQAGVARVVYAVTDPGTASGGGAERLRAAGGEFGTTTGRPRRCGWFDALIVEQAVAYNGITDLFLTKLDILTGWEKIPVCVAYEVDGERREHQPVLVDEFARSRPVYEYLDGWTEDISHCRTFDELPANTQAYVRRLEELCRCRISGIGVGQGREQVIMLHDLID